MTCTRKLCRHGVRYTRQIAGGCESHAPNYRIYRDLSYMYYSFFCDIFYCFGWDGAI